MAEAPKKTPEKTPAPAAPRKAATEPRPRPATPASGSGTSAGKPATPAKKASASPKSSKPSGAATAPPEAPQASTTEEKVEIVETQAPRKHQARLKPQLSDAERKRLRLRRAIAGRRPVFRRQQWYEYRRLADSGWRRPTGVDSAARRHFGYETKVVRIGFRGPADVRGLHPSGFEEVRVVAVQDLAGLDPKRQAARVAGTLGRRKLQLVYAEADKLGIRVLNRRRFK